MSGAAVIRAATRGTVRRPVQNAVVLVVLAFSTAATLLALAALTSANQGFLAAFSAQHEAQVAVTINSAQVTAAQVAQLRHLPGVTNAAGPYPEATITAKTHRAGGRPSRHGATSGSVTTPPGGAVPPGVGVRQEPASGGSTSKSQAPAVRQGSTPGGTHRTINAAGGSTTQTGNSTTFTVVGRASPSGTLHRISANPSILDGITHGQSRWPSQADEISIAQDTGIRVPLGSALTVSSAPGKPELKVVGYGSQAEPYDFGWVLPSEIAALRAPAAPAREEMFFDFTDAATQTQLNADLSRVARALPAGAIASSESYLRFEQVTGRAQSVNAPFITTFAILALVLAVLIVANVIAAAVIASYRRIGVLKSLGFTPAQVTTVYVAQAGLPALIGAATGALLGNHWALPLIELAPVAHVSVPVWIDVTAPLAMLALTGLAAALPAVRAGRLSAVAAITAGQAPRAGRGYLSHRLAGRLPLPRPLTIGIAAPFSRPARSAITLVSITAGLTAVILAAGLSSSIHKINHSSIQGLGDIQVQPRPPAAVLTPAQASAVSAAVRSEPRTRHYVAESDEVAGAVTAGPSAGSGVARGTRSQILHHLSGASVVVRVPGRATYLLSVVAYGGDASWLGWALIAGSWYHGAGEVDASPQLLAEIGKRVGQDMTMTVNRRPVTVRIAGEVFVPNPVPELFLSAETLGYTVSTLGINSYDINLAPGSATSAYITALTDRIGAASYFVVTPTAQSIAALIKSSYFRLLALLIAVVAALGVLNSVLMATRERAHDLGVFKAIGMTPRQTIAMVLCWVIGPTIIAALIALPVGLIVQDKLIRHLAVTSANLILPGSFVHVLSTGELALLTLAGLGIAAAGALVPAARAAASRTTDALRTE
jgi:putative ABC transport system permease protein